MKAYSEAFGFTVGLFSALISVLSLLISNLGIYGPLIKASFNLLFAELLIPASPNPSLQGKAYLQS